MTLFAVAAPDGACQAGQEPSGGFRLGASEGVEMAGRKLKVFQAQFGFYDTVVAAASQAEALRAWGTHQNLFASGDAKVTTDQAAVAAALKHPQTPLRRAVGSTDAFQLEPTGLPAVPDAPNRGAAKRAPKKAEVAAPTAPPADRRALDAAEAAVHTVDEARKREEADLRQRQDELDAKTAAAQGAYVDRRKAATAALVEARRKYRAAGGKD
jgi:hypothetical protein